MKIDILSTIKISNKYHTMKILHVEKFIRKELRKKLSGTKIHKFKKVKGEKERYLARQKSTD